VFSWRQSVALTLPNSYGGLLALPKLPAIETRGLIAERLPSTGFARTLHDIQSFVIST
jgi:hypothetical protein